MRDKLDFSFEDMGEQQVKNIARPVRTHRIVVGSTAQPIAAAAAAATELSLPDKPSIAVLPFQNMSGDPEQEYFADGMVEEIITALSRDPLALRRSPAIRALPTRGKPVDVKQVGRELGVRYVLEGSVRKARQPGADHRAADRSDHRPSHLGRSLRWFSSTTSSTCKTG